MTEHHGPDGGIESTVADVLAFYRALFYGSELISQKTGAISEHFAKTGDSWASFGGGTGISAAVQLDLKNDYQVIVLANTDRLVAEEISGRIYSYIQTGTYDPVVLPPVAFAWEMYVEMGQDTFASDFPESYQSAGYSQFVGRTLNELGMSLVNDAMWQDAFIVFGALIELFPEAPQAYDSLAYAHFRSGNSGLARDTFSMALKLQPEFASDYSSDNYGTPAQYPLLDGRCDEYRPIGAEVIAESDELAVLFFQDEDYVWLCYTLPDRSYGTLDLVVDSPALAGPVNLHVSAQLGEWQVDQPDERPGVADSDRWWNVNGWWSNAVAWNGMRETDQATRPNFQASHGRELQMSKTRFGRGTWRLSFSIDSVRDANAGMKRVVLPPEGKAPIVVEVF